MPTNTTARPITAQESHRLAQMLRESPNAGKRFKLGLENALVGWATSMLAIMVVWQCAAWLAKRTTAWEIGWYSPYALGIFVVSLILTAGWTSVSSIRWIQGWKDWRPELQADMDGGHVVEERYRFVGAKRFEEPEHRGLMYCLHTEDDRVFVLFDGESQQLGVTQGNPLDSSFRPCSDLCLVRAPKSRFVLDTQFSGTPLEVGVSLELTAAPKDWPESEAYCDIPWGELESRLSVTSRS